MTPKQFHDSLVQFKESQDNSIGFHLVEMYSRLDAELKAAMEVFEAAKSYLSWSKVDCPACTLGTPSEGVPCYCYDALDSKDSLINSIKKLDEVRRG